MSKLVQFCTKSAILADKVDKSNTIEESKKRLEKEFRTVARQIKSN